LRGGSSTILCTTRHVGRGLAVREATVEKAREHLRLGARVRFQLRAPVEQRTLDAYVEHLRQKAATAYAEAERLLRPKIDEHLDIYQGAIDELARTHALLVEQSDLDAHPRTRSIAIWELAGRALSLAHALIDQLRRGYGPQTIGTTRLMFEAATLLEAFSEAEEETVRKWLDGGHVPVSEARKHLIALAERSSEEAAQAGSAVEANPAYLALVAELEATSDYQEFIDRRRESRSPTDGVAVVIEYLNRGEYGQLSHQRGGHNDRAGLSFARDVRLKQFFYGPHPDARVLAKHVDEASHDIERVVIVVGFCIARFFLGPDYQEETIKPMQRSFETVRLALPLHIP
jgi:hypothetical protein